MYDPMSEKHFPLLVVKIIDNGNEEELQIENCRTGGITRLSPDGQFDSRTIETTVALCLKSVLREYQREKKEKEE